jgi:hypothetical protein
MTKSDHVIESLEPRFLLSAIGGKSAFVGPLASANGPTEPRLNDEAYFSRKYVGKQMWQFGGGHYVGSGDPNDNPLPPDYDYQSMSGSTLGFSYSGTGALPAPQTFTVTLDTLLPLDEYHLFVKNFYVGQMDATIGNTTKPLTIRRYEWTDVQDFEINTAGDQTNQIVLRYYPNQIVPNTGVYQEQYYIIQGVYITNDLQETIIKDGQVVKLLDTTPPPLQGAGINYVEDASFETGQGHGWGQPMGFVTLPITSHLDATTAVDGTYSLKFDLPKVGTKYQFPLESKFYRLNPSSMYTLSGYMKASRSATSLSISLVGLAGNLTDDAYTLGTTGTVGTNWQRFSVTGTPASLSGYLYGVRFLSNEDTPITVWVDAVQLEEGSLSSFKTRETVQVGMVPTVPGNIYYSNQPASATLRLYNPQLLAGTTVDCQVYNWFDQLVADESLAVNLNGQRNVEVPLSLPASSQGDYRMVFRIAGSNNPAEIVYSVIPPNPSLNNKYAQGTLGTDASFDPAALAILKRANYNWVMSKFDARWYLVEPTQDQFVWNDQDMINADNAKMNIMLQFGNPDWGRQAFVAANVPTGYPSAANWPADMRARYLTDWNDFVSHTVNHYKQWVKNWEVENEPNAGFQYQDYAEILKQSYQTIKAADSTATVAGFSGGGFTQSWYDSIINLIGTGYFDAMSVHLYNNDQAIHQAFGNYLRSKNKPGWNTETGLTGNHFFQTLPTYNSVAYSNAWQQNMIGNWAQTRTSVNNYLLSVSEGGMSRYFYYFNRFTNSGPTQPTRRGGNGKEMVEYDGSLRPNGVGLSIASSFIDGTTYNSKYTRTGMTAHLYTKTGGVNGFFWLTSGIFRTPASGSAGSDVTYYDLLGNVLPPNTDYNPNGGPVYFTTSLTNITTIQNQRLGQLALNTSTSNAAPLAFLSQVPGSVHPGSAVTVLVSGRDLDEDGQTITAYEVSLNGTVLSSAPTTQGLYTFTAPNTAGTYALTLRVRDNEGTWSPLVATNLTVDNTFVWNGGGDGVSWSDPLNWAPHSLPGAANDVIISVAGAPTIHVNGNVSIRNLQLDEALVLSAGAHAVLRLGSLTIGPGGSLDLADNALIVDYDSLSPVDAVTSMIKAGRNGGSWNGNGIITSAANGNLTTLGVAEASQVLDFSASQMAPFGGEMVDATTGLVKFTYGGDANLDGKINIDDYGHIDTSIGIGIAGWINGDFNYDGKINIDDYGIIDVNVGIQGPPLAGAPAANLPSSQTTRTSGDQPALVEAPPAREPAHTTGHAQWIWSGWSAYPVQEEVGRRPSVALLTEARREDLLSSLPDVAGY